MTLETYDIVYVDDEGQLTTMFESFLGMLFDNKYSVRTYNDPRSLLADIRGGRVVAGLWLIDVMMDGIDGVELADNIRQQFGDAPLVFAYTALQPEVLNSSYAKSSAFTGVYNKLQPLDNVIQELSQRLEFERFKKSSQTSAAPAVRVPTFNELAGESQPDAPSQEQPAPPARPAPVEQPAAAPAPSKTAPATPAGKPDQAGSEPAPQKQPFQASLFDSFPQATPAPTAPTEAEAPRPEPRREPEKATPPAPARPAQPKPAPVPTPRPETAHRAREGAQPAPAARQPAPAAKPAQPRTSTPPAPPPATFRLQVSARVLAGGGGGQARASLRGVQPSPLAAEMAGMTGLPSANPIPGGETIPTSDDLSPVAGWEVPIPNRPANFRLPTEGQGSAAAPEPAPAAGGKFRWLKTALIVLLFVLLLSGIGVLSYLIMYAPK